jgi:hypothetical protein
MNAVEKPTREQLLARLAEIEAAMRYANLYELDRLIAEKQLLLAELVQRRP